MRYNYEYKGLIALVKVLSERRNPPRLATYFLQYFEGTDLVRILTSPPRKYVRTMQPILSRRSHFF